ncbi:MAG: cold shock domain-containing protein [Phocaeicola dorei]|nr:cold shock domain-containing protein [Phocaeicola dorei]
MAKPISFTKRDLEKKKQEKRLAKQQKKEERKNNGTSSFEDMIAYVDENGMITDTPPISNNKPQEVDMSTIEVSTPRRTEEPIVKNAEKYFFHISGLIDNIIENNIVTFELEKGSRGMNAVKIKLKK